MNSTVVDEKRLVELYNNGMKAQDIADELGISYLRKNGVEWRYPIRLDRGLKNVLHVKHPTMYIKSTGKRRNIKCH